MAGDITKGAIKWFSPRSMPKESEAAKCSPPVGTGNAACGGGLIKVTDHGGKRRNVYAPGYVKGMGYVPLTGVRDWFLSDSIN